MGRTRLIKYETFLNSKLGKLPPENRLLFIGLWCIADREGRLKDDPERIKAQLFPYDNFDVDPMLNQLADGDDPFIARYEIDGKAFIQVIHFKDHQHCHRNEAESQIPDIDGLYPNGRRAKTINGHTMDIPKTDQEHTMDTRRLPACTSTCTSTSTSRAEEEKVDKIGDKESALLQLIQELWGGHVVQQHTTEYGNIEEILQYSDEAIHECFAAAKTAQIPRRNWSWILNRLRYPERYGVKLESMNPQPKPHYVQPGDAERRLRAEFPEIFKPKGDEA